MLNIYQGAAPRLDLASATRDTTGVRDGMCSTFFSRHLAASSDRDSRTTSHHPTKTSLSEDQRMLRGFALLVMGILGVVVGLAVIAVAVG